MVTELEYLKAKKAVDKYELQQKIKIKRFGAGDIDLLTVLSVRSKNALIAHNECKWTKEGEELIYISDIVKAIKKDGRVFNGTGKRKGKIYYYLIIRLKNLGYKSHDEIMKYIEPYL